MDVDVGFAVARGTRLAGSWRDCSLFTDIFDTSSSFCVVLCLLLEEIVGVMAELPPEFDPRMPPPNYYGVPSLVSFRTTSEAVVKVGFEMAFP